VCILQLDHPSVEKCMYSGIRFISVTLFCDVFVSVTCFENVNKVVDTCLILLRSWSQYTSEFASCLTALFLLSIMLCLLITTFILI